MVWFILSFVLQYGENDVGHLPSNFYDCLLWIHLPFVCNVCLSEAIVTGYCDPASLYYHRTELLVAPECLLAVGFLVSATVTSRNQAEVAGELPLVLESCHIVDLCQYRHCHNSPNTGDALQQLVVVLVPVKQGELTHLSCRSEQR